jgi:GT2 family glycosyltransferase
MQKTRTRNYVHIITTSFDDLSNTKRVIECFSKQTYKFSRLVIVDHGKNHKTYKEFSGHFLGVEIVKANPDLWWTGALNEGISYALKTAIAGDYILTINNDCTFDKNFVLKIVNISSKNNRVIVGSFEIDAKDKKTIITGIIKIDWQKGVFKNLKDLKFGENDTLSTNGTLIPIEVFKKNGLLDKKHFPHYGSDYEFFIRAKSNRFKLVSSNSVYVYGDEERTGIFDTGGQLSYKRVLSLAFSRKSQINLLDHINLIHFCCPEEYRVKNYLFLVKKAVHFLLRVYPFSIVQKYTNQNAR